MAAPGGGSVTIVFLVCWFCVNVNFATVTASITNSQNYDDQYQLEEQVHQEQLQQQQQFAEMLSDSNEVREEGRSRLLAYVGRLMEVEISVLVSGRDQRLCDNKERVVEGLPSWLQHDKDKGVLQGVPTSRHAGRLSTITVLCPSVSPDHDLTLVTQLTVTVVWMPSDVLVLILPSGLSSGVLVDVSSPDHQSDYKRQLSSFVAKKDRDSVEVNDIDNKADNIDQAFKQMSSSPDELAAGLETDKSNDGVSAFQESRRCSNHYVASLVLCASPDKLSDSQRVQVIQRSAEFLSVHSHILTWLPSYNGQLQFVDKGYSVESGGASDDHSCQELTQSELFWPLSCSAGRHVYDLAKILQHNVEVGRVHTELGLEVMGWYVASKIPRSRHRRRRRQVYRTPTPTPTIYPPTATVSPFLRLPEVDSTAVNQVSLSTTLSFFSQSMEASVIEALTTPPFSTAEVPPRSDLYLSTLHTSSEVSFDSPQLMSATQELTSKSTADNLGMAPTISGSSSSIIGVETSSTSSDHVHSRSTLSSSSLQSSVGGLETESPSVDLDSSIMLHSSSLDNVASMAKLDSSVQSQTLHSTQETLDFMTVTNQVESSLFTMTSVIVTTSIDYTPWPDRSGMLSQTAAWSVSLSSTYLESNSSPALPYMAADMEGDKSEVVDYGSAMVLSSPQVSESDVSRHDFKTSLTTVYQFSELVSAPSSSMSLLTEMNASTSLSVLHQQITSEIHGLDSLIISQTPSLSRNVGNIPSTMLRSISSEMSDFHEVYLTSVATDQSLEGSSPIYTVVESDTTSAAFDKLSNALETTFDDVTVITSQTLITPPVFVSTSARTVFEALVSHFSTVNQDRVATSDVIFSPKTLSSTLFHAPTSAIHSSSAPIVGQASISSTIPLETTPMLSSVPIETDYASWSQSSTANIPLLGIATTAVTSTGTTAVSFDDVQFSEQEIISLSEAAVTSRVLVSSNTESSSPIQTTFATSTSVLNTSGITESTMLLPESSLSSSSDLIGTESLFNKLTTSPMTMSISMDRPATTSFSSVISSEVKSSMYITPSGPVQSLATTSASSVQATSIPENIPASLGTDRISTLMSMPVSRGAISTVIQYVPSVSISVLSPSQASSFLLMTSLFEDEVSTITWFDSGSVYSTPTVISSDIVARSDMISSETVSFMLSSSPFVTPSIHIPSSVTGVKSESVALSPSFSPSVTSTETTLSVSLKTPDSASLISSDILNFTRMSPESITPISSSILSSPIPETMSHSLNISEVIAPTSSSVPSITSLEIISSFSVMTPEIVTLTPSYVSSLGFGWSSSSRISDSFISLSSYPSLVASSALTSSFASVNASGSMPIGSSSTPLDTLSYPFPVPPMPDSSIFSAQSTHSISVDFATSQIRLTESESPATKSSAFMITDMMTSRFEVMTPEVPAVTTASTHTFPIDFTTSGMETVALVSLLQISVSLSSLATDIVPPRMETMTLESLPLPSMTGDLPGSFIETMTLPSSIIPSLLTTPYSIASHTETLSPISRPTSITAATDVLTSQMTTSETPTLISIPTTVDMIASQILTVTSERSQIQTVTSETSNIVPSPSLSSEVMSSSPTLPPTESIVLTTAVTTSMPPVSTTTTATATTECTSRSSTTTSSATSPSVTTAGETRSSEMTEETTVMTSSDPPSTSEVPNTAPEVVNAVRHLSVSLGQYFQWSVPEDMFFDLHEGRTRSLTLTVTLPRYHQPLPPNFWVQFDASEQVMFGLPLVADLDTGYHSVEIVARDSEGLTATNTLNLYVNSSAFIQFTHRFVMTFDIEFAQFMHQRGNLMTLLTKIASYYGDNTAQSVTVVDVSTGSFVLTWTNSSLSGLTCHNQTIDHHLNRMVRRDGSVRNAFNRHIGKALNLQSIILQLEGACLHPPVISSAATTPSDFQTSGSSSQTDILEEIVVPVLVVLLLVLVIVIVLLIVNRCRNQRGSMETLDKELYTADRSPVILPHEVPDVDVYNTRPKKPIILPLDDDVESLGRPYISHEHYRKVGTRFRPGNYTYDDEELPVRPVTVIFNNFDSINRPSRSAGFWNERSESTSPNIRSHKHYHDYATTTTTM